MPPRPCTVCGGPHDGPGRCPDCARAADNARDRVRDRSNAHWNTTRWKKLSARARKLSPFCEICGSRHRLETDHILPIVEFPELTYVIENCRVLCRTHNRARGHRWTQQDRAVVVERLRASYRRRPTSRLSDALKVAQRDAQPPGEGPPAGPVAAPPVRQENDHTPLTCGDANESHYVGHSDREVRR